MRELRFTISAVNTAGPEIDAVTTTLDGLSATLGTTTTQTESAIALVTTMQQSLIELTAALALTATTVQEQWTAAAEAFIQQTTGMSERLNDLNTMTASWRQDFIGHFQALVVDINNLGPSFAAGGENLIDMLQAGMASRWDEFRSWFIARLSEIESYVQGNSPPVAGPWQDMDRWSTSFWPTVMQGMEAGVPELQARVQVALDGVRSQVTTPAPPSRGRSRAPSGGTTNIHFHGLVVDGPGVQSALRQLNEPLRTSDARSRRQRRA